MLITALREKFRFNSAPELLDQCVDRFGLTFVVFTRILQDSHLFDEPVEDEKRKIAFDIANWKLVDKKLVNEQMAMSVLIPEQYF